MDIYRRKPVLVEALQIEPGDGWNRAFDWLSELEVRATMTIDTQTPEADVINVEVDGFMLSAYTGDWLVWVNGRIDILSNEDFWAEYAREGEAS